MGVVKIQQGKNRVYIALICLFNEEIFLEIFFFFKIPLFPAIASCFWQILKSSCDFFLSFLPMLSRRSFILVLNFKEILLFLKNLVLSCLTLFFADFVIGIKLIKKKYLISYKQNYKIIQ